MVKDDQDVQEGWQQLCKLVEETIPDLIPEHGYPEIIDTSGGAPTNTSTALKIPDPVPEPLLFAGKSILSIEKLLQYYVKDVVNTFTVAQLSFIFALSSNFIRTRHFALKAPATPPLHLALFVDRIRWDGGPTGLAVKREGWMFLNHYSITFNHFNSVL